MLEKPLSICLVAHNAYGNVTKKNTGHIGGVEVQIALMANWFAQKGYKTSLITWDHGQQDGEVVDGITIYKLGKKDAGLPLLKFFSKWAHLRNAMKRANADVYYYNCGDVALGQIVQWTKRRGKKTLYSVCNEVDCLSELPLLPEWRERAFYKYGLERADAIAVQTFRQQTLLHEHYQLDSRQIPYPSEGFPATTPGEEMHQDPRRILWIGRFSDQKRLDWLLDLANRLPEYTFDVIGSSNADDEKSGRLVERAKTMANVKLLGRVPHHEMGPYYRSARVLCCTSSHEGFPNIFLEAWSTGLPTVTTFDPDGVVAKNRIGAVAGSIEELTSAIKESTIAGTWDTLSKNALEYFQNNHRVDKSVEQFEQMFLELARRERTIV